MSGKAKAIVLALATVAAFAVWIVDNVVITRGDVYAARAAEQWDIIAGLAWIGCLIVLWAVPGKGARS